MRSGNTDPGQTITGSGEAHPRHSHRPDDRSPSLDGLGPWAFGRCIQRVSFPQCFRLPTNIAKYTRETNPGIWVLDFQLAYRADGVDDYHFIIQYLPIYIGEHVRAWLKFLPCDRIHDWADLKRVFVGNF